MTSTYLIQRVLDTPMNDPDSGAATIRDYFKKLLVMLWRDGDGFNSKRPFGNSSWEFDVYRALVVAGLVPGTIDEDGYLDEFTDEARSDAFYMVLEAIKALE